MSFLTTFTKRCFSLQSLESLQSLQLVPLPIIAKVTGVYRYSDEDDYTYKSGMKIIDIYSEDKNIGLVQYNNKTGEIGMLIIHETFRNMGLGKFILKNIINEMKQNEIKEVWAISNKKQSFWLNVNNKSFTYRFPAHPTTIHGGFYMKL